MWENVFSETVAIISRMYVLCLQYDFEIPLRGEGLSSLHWNLGGPVTGK